MAKRGKMAKKVTLEPTQEKIKISKRRIFLSRVKRRILKHVLVIRVFVISVFISLLIGVGVLIFGYLKTTSIGFYWELAKDFLTTPAGILVNQNGQTNILILGKGGKGHEAPDLTDTMIFASVDNSTSKITLVSLPRDIWIYDLKTKLNSAYFWGNKKVAGGGLVLAKSTVESIVGQDIDYAVTVDFGGFKEIIDVLGGIDVDIQNSFSDEKFPIAGKENDTCDGDPTFSCRYETISFSKGITHMDGETALKFVRSRYAQGDEGTDFARAARQQKVIEAIKNKVLTKEILTSPKKLIALKNAVLESIETDLTPQEAAVLARHLLSARKNISTHILPEELLYRPPYTPEYDNLYVFVPKLIDKENPSGRSWSKVHDWVSCVLTDGSCEPANFSN